MSVTLTRAQMEAFLAAHPRIDPAYSQGRGAASHADHDGHLADDSDAPAHGHDHGPHWIQDAGQYLRDHDIAIASEREGSQGEHIYVLAACVWDPAHTDHAAIVEQWPDGRVTAKCSHNSCAGKKLAEFRDTVEGPEWRTPPDQHHQQSKQSRRDQALATLNQVFTLGTVTAAPSADQEQVEQEAAAAGATGGGSAQEQVITELFHDAAGETYMTVPVGVHHATMRLGSRDAKQWVRHQAYLHMGVTLSDGDVKEIMDHLAARAQFDGPVREVAQRVWQPAETTIWLDLGDDTHRAVKITPHGWALYDDPPVKFIRKRGCLPLPVPRRSDLAGETVGAALERHLRPLINIAPQSANGADHDWVLLVSWLLATLRLRGPFAVLQLKGERGTAKSTAGRVLRRLVDPHQVLLEPQPGSLRDMAIAAQGSWMLAYDNLSHLTTAMSNALCMLSTGGGFRTRQLFTDDEEAIFSYQRPVLLTGIAGVVVRPDLLDRTITVTLPVIPKRARKAEERFWREFETQHGAILGALLSVLSRALAALPAVAEREWPRLADFARWACAVEAAMDWPAGAFMAALGAVENEATQTALEDSPIAELLTAFLNAQRRAADWHDQSGHVLWRGTMTDLLKELKRKVFDDTGDANPERTRPGCVRAILNESRALERK